MILFNTCFLKCTPALKKLPQRFFKLAVLQRNPDIES